VKVLIVKLGAFGDIVHCLPALDDLLLCPEVSEVHWLVDHCYVQVTALLPEQVICHQVYLKKPRDLSKTWQVVRQLRNKKFDVVLDLQGLLKSGLLARCIARNAYGFDARFSPEKGNAWFVKAVRFHDDEKHVVQQYRRIASVLQKTVETGAIPYIAPHIPMTSQLVTLQQDILYGLRVHHFVLLHLGGGWDTKKLAESTWVELAEKITEQGFTPVYSWGNREEQVLAHQLADQAYAVVLPDKLDVLTLAALLSAAKAVIGADTGLVHLAAAMGVPTASFWGPSASWRSGPQGSKHVHAESKPECGPCFQRTCANFICMEKIQVKDLLRVLSV